MKFISNVEYQRKEEGVQGGLDIFFGGKEPFVIKGFKFGPYTSDFYDVNLCKNGAIDLLVDGKLHKIKAGTLFVVPPYAKVEKTFAENTETVYLNIKGEDAEKIFSAVGFTRDNVVFEHAVSEKCVEYIDNMITLLTTYSSMNITTFDQNVLPEIISTHDVNYIERAMRRNGIFYLFVAELFKLSKSNEEKRNQVDSRESYVRAAIRHIELNCGFDITVDAIAKHVGLNRSYLYTLFREETGMSIRDYIIQARIKVACDLLENSNVPIKTIAASIRYEPVAFAHLFKKAMGISAIEYRNKYRKTAY